MCDGASIQNARALERAGAPHKHRACRRRLSAYRRQAFCFFEIWLAREAGGANRLSLSAGNGRMRAVQRILTM